MYQVVATQTISEGGDGQSYHTVTCAYVKVIAPVCAITTVISMMQSPKHQLWKGFVCSVERGVALIRAGDMLVVGVVFLPSYTVVWTRPGISSWYVTRTSGGKRWVPLASMGWGWREQDRMQPGMGTTSLGSGDEWRYIGRWRVRERQEERDKRIQGTERAEGEGRRGGRREREEEGGEEGRRRKGGGGRGEEEEGEERRRRVRRGGGRGEGGEGEERRRERREREEGEGEGRGWEGRKMGREEEVCGYPSWDEALRTASLVFPRTVEVSVPLLLLRSPSWCGQRWTAWSIQDRGNGLSPQRILE